MKHLAWVVLGVCCSVSLGAQEVSVFTPSRRSDAPVFMNGQVVRIDRAAGTITIRNDNGQRVLRLDRQAMAGLGQLRAGSSVIVGLQTTGTGASERSLVTDIRPSGAVTTAPNRVSARASMTSSGARSIGTAQVVTVDAAGRRLTVVDSAGATRVLDVRGGAVGTLGTLQSGDTVSLGVAAPLVAGTPAGTVTSIDATSVSGNAQGSLALRSGSTSAVGSRTLARGTVTTFSNDSLPRAPALPRSPNNGLDTNPATTGVQPVPGAQPIPGVQTATGVQPVPGMQGVTGIQPVPGAQPLPGTGVTGQTAANPGLTTEPVPGTTGQTGINSSPTGQITTNPGMTPEAVPGTGGQNAVNAGATGGVSTVANSGGVSTGVNTGGNATAIPGNVAVPGITGLSGGMSSRGVGSGGTGGAGPATGARGGATTGTGSRGGSSVVGGGSPVLSPSVPQLGGGSVGGINSQIPSIPPSSGNMNVPVLPPPTVATGSTIPTTPAEVAKMRELASRDFDMAAAVLGARAAEVDRAWIAYRSQCVSSTGPLNNRSREWFGVLDGSLGGPTEDICEASFNEVARMAQGLAAGLDNARDTARRADVLPGRMREVLQRYNLDL
jgi:hypothetical protein